MVSNANCVVFLFSFSLSSVPYVASFSGLSIFDCPFDILLRLLNRVHNSTNINKANNHLSLEHEKGIKKTYDVGIPFRYWFEIAHKWGGIKPVNGIPSHSLLIMHVFIFLFSSRRTVHAGIYLHNILVKQELLTLPDHPSSPSVFSGVRVTRSLVLCVCFVDRCWSCCTFSFCHCVVCPSSIYIF